MPAVPAQSIAPDHVPATKAFCWSIRREFWENRTLYIAPLAVSVLFLFGFIISLMHLPAKIRASAQGPALAQVFMDESYGFAALMIMGTMIIVGFFYCLDALYGERRDRSILFWKSLPVSDLTTVLSKASIPLLILPLLCFTVTIILWVVIWILSSAAALASGHNISALRTTLPLSSLSLFLFFHLVGIHGLGYAPIYGWMLLVSSWARRAPFLWATLPLFVIGILERTAFNTSYFADLMGYVLRGGGHRMESKATAISALLIPDQTLGEFLTSPGLWIGLAVTAAFLAAAMRLRRSQGPI
jgi:ABC-2 type transport system permease protein